MRAGGVVVREVTAQQTSEKPFVDHDDVIEAFASNRADDALGERILPGRPRGDEDLAHSEDFHPPYERVAVDGISIAEQVLGRCLFSEALDQLVSGPRRCTTTALRPGLSWSAGRYGHYMNGNPELASGFPVDECRTLLEVPKDALDLLQGTAKVFGDLSRPYVRVG